MNIPPEKKSASQRAEIVVGEYSLQRGDGGILWLSDRSGEGMEVNEVTFEAALRDFYKTWF